MFKQLVCLAFVVGSAALAETASAQDGDPIQGRMHAERLCADCHHIGPGPEPLTAMAGPPFASVVKTKGMTAMALGVWLQTSHPTMPNIMLRPGTRADIIAYILSLKKPEQKAG